MVDATPKISVLIPTLNGSRTLSALFTGLARQSLQPTEILVADSESDDDSVAISEKAGAQVIVIPRSTYDHGGTRTLLAQKASSEILVFLTQDAIPASDSSLYKLVEPLLRHKTPMACSYGRQLPNKNATLVSAHLRNFNYPVESSTRCYADKAKLGLKTAFISNSFAAYRKESLAGVGYFRNSLIFGEDTCILGLLLKAGFTVAYVGDATVYHSHNYSLTEEFRRAYDIGVLHEREKWLLDDFGQAEGVGFIYVRSLFRCIVAQKRYHLLVDAALRTMVKFLGYRLGRNYLRHPAAVHVFCSMNKAWWKKAQPQDE
jgi:rhamnosyltransferase